MREVVIASVIEPLYRPAGAWDFVLAGFYKYVAPTALAESARGLAQSKTLRAVRESLVIAERLDCGDFSTAFRPHEGHPPFQVLRPHESAAEAGAVQDASRGL